MYQLYQIVEATVVSLFTPWLGGILSHVNSITNVFVPYCLQHDLENHVLCLTDFGESIPLTQFLNSTPPTIVGLEHARSIGARIGLFFAKLHSPSAFELVHDSEYGKTILQNSSSGRALVQKMVVQPLQATMVKFGISVEESKTLADAVTQHWDEEEQRPNAAFILGDSWTGSVLVRMDQGKVKVAMIDWEFASFDSSGVCSDIATMMAHIRLRAIAANAAGNSEAFNACEVLARDMAKSYRKISMGESAPWTRQSRNTNDSEEWEPLARNICLVIGRDMVNNASDLEWDCSCCGQDRSKETCELKVTMVQDGVEFLRAGTTSTRAELLQFITGDPVLKSLTGLRMGD
jgi:hypothetical protein